MTWDSIRQRTWRNSVSAAVGLAMVMGVFAAPPAVAGDNCWTEASIPYVSGGWVYAYAYSDCQSADPHIEWHKTKLQRNRAWGWDTVKQAWDYPPPNYTLAAYAARDCNNDSWTELRTYGDSSHTSSHKSPSGTYFYCRP